MSQVLQNPLDFPLAGSRLIEASAGTGKTYTTMSILNQLLSYFQQQITVSAFQIYNNDIYDLLTNKPLKYFKTTKLVIKGKSSLVIEQEREKYCDMIKQTY